MFLLLKIAWLVKYPAALLIGTVREYRRRVVVRRRNRLETREIGFFHQPLRALADRRFWIRGVTNLGELLLHLIALWAWVYNRAGRWWRAAFVEWRTTHRTESEVFHELEHAQWREVFAGTYRWVRDGARFWRRANGEPLMILPHARWTGWREVHFNGGVIAIRPPRPGQRASRRKFQRPGWRDSLEILSDGRACILIRRMDAGGGVLEEHRIAGDQPAALRGGTGECLGDADRCDATAVEIVKPTVGSESEGRRAGS
ncbi:MAG: hypothetical protein HRF50_09690 [Phycisphaerae bacterium]|jgi:hypothetical protein